MNINSKLALELNIKDWQVESVISLLDEGNTVPFIARYRKEKTGDMDDIVLRNFFERLQYLRNLEERRDDVVRLIDEQGKMTEELKTKIYGCEVLNEIEDIYRPFKPKKRTRAIIAVEKGLRPLGDMIFEGLIKEDVTEATREFINEASLTIEVEEAIAGACDIISETISDEAEVRKFIRSYVQKEGLVETKGDSKERTPFEMYYDYKESAKQIPPHRILAMNRGEKEKILNVKITADMDKIIQYLKGRFLKGNIYTDKYVEISILDSLKRLIYPSIEREIRSDLTSIGEEGAIDIFKANLKALLLQSPIKDKVIMGYDPGFRTGSKIAVLDDTGKFLDYSTIYATLPHNDVNAAISKMKELIYKYKVEVISLGNGTASRESEEVIVRLLKEVKAEKGLELSYVIVSEAGASVYSASELASKEYPDIDVSIRGAISIGRRLQDPMAELVKIDPKSIGVGQYQHDVTPKKLDESLKGIVEDCVNSVGVDINIATPSLLSYISGINSTIAQNIVAYREENGKFKNRKDILKVKRLGDKVFQQCAGFLRVRESKEPLDNTSVHPESYEAAQTLLKELGYEEKDFNNSGLRDIEGRADQLGIVNLAKKLDIGTPTLRDIIKELKKPGRDLRDDLQKPILKTGIIELSQLKPGMMLMGTVRNVSDFGAFVDIGVHQDGLVHKSQLANRYVNHPLDVVKVGDVVEVRVLEIDENRKRISLSMKTEIK
ncbi:MAG TPA: Tex family protein [Clostridiaceae bacterium]